MPTTTLKAVELRCPVCEEKFTSLTVVTTNSFGGKRTDFHERASGNIQPLPFQIHMCVRCCFTASERTFLDGIQFSPYEKDLFRKEMSFVESGNVPGSLKYEAAAKCAGLLNQEHGAIADFFLRASWCCVNEGDTEAERYYRRFAAWEFEAALGHLNDVPRDERASLTYLVGELWRRIGDKKKASAWFDRVPSEITDPDTQQWIINAARQQRDCPREWFG